MLIKKGEFYLKDTNLKTKIFIAVFALVIIGTIGAYLYKKASNNSYEELEILDENIEDEESENLEENNEITVHIIGEVKYPGVIVLKSGQRVVDAIEAAGGQTEEADLDRLNLAEILNDGDKIYVPNINDEETEEISQNNSKNATININIATAEELTQLPGIGEATANKIIEYRKQNGKFKTTEELKNVSGIGESKYENLKDKITVK